MMIHLYRVAVKDVTLTCVQRGASPLGRYFVVREADAKILRAAIASASERLLSEQRNKDKMRNEQVRAKQVLP